MSKLRLLLTLITAVPALAAAAVAVGASNPLNDLFALGQAGGDSPAHAPVIEGKENLRATPLAKCGPGSHKQPSVDGRVPAGTASKGFNCNIKLLGHQGTEGGFKVYRYVDTHGHECAFYDQTLMFPLNAINATPATGGGGAEGVAVLDMSNPAKPKLTDTLTTPPMVSPHESVNLNSRRGLLAAVNGNLATEPGLVAIYDVHSDCRHPVLTALGPYARFGHESGFAADGKTFYATSTAFQAITALDVSDPHHPTAVWQGNVYSHGMSLSRDGKRGYIADPGTGPGAPKAGLLILDTSEIQARKPNPHVREVSRLTWPSVSIPQNAIPFTRKGKPYILEIDEYNKATLHQGGDPDVVGAARIIDISNEKKPFIVSNLRLAINNHAAHAAAKNDPGANNPAQGYAAHYCNVEKQVDPKLVACSFIASGLRVFDISNLKKPREIAYYVAPPKPRSENGESDSDFAMSKPAIIPSRHEIWWTDGTSGFYALRVTNNMWPHPSSKPKKKKKKTTKRKCRDNDRDDAPSSGKHDCDTKH